MRGTGIGLIWDEPGSSSAVGTTSRTVIRSHWNALHSYSPPAEYRPDQAAAFFSHWWATKPICNCGDSDRLLIDCPPVFDTFEDFFVSGIHLHNMVNKKIESEDASRYYPRQSIEAARAEWHSIAPRNSSRVVVMLAAGRQAKSLARVTAEYAHRWADRCDADFVLLSNQIENDWRLEKFRVGPIARQYEQCVFLDCDTIVSDLTPDLFEMIDADVSIVDDLPLNPSTEWMQADYDWCLHSQGVRSQRVTQALNTGVVYTRGAGHRIWELPKRPFCESHCAEQWWIQYQLESAIAAGDVTFERMPIAFNYQDWYPGYSQLEKYAWIHHFSSSRDYSEKLRRITAFVS